MLKKLIPLLLIPALLFSDEVKHDYYFGGAQVRNNVVYMQGCQTAMVPFAPCLPTRHINLLLPHGQKAVSFTVKYDKSVLLKGEYFIRAFRPSGRIGVPPPKDYYRRRSEVYEKNEFYPSTVKSPRFFTHYKNGHPIFIASINPVQYNPISGKLQYFKKITVSVQTETVRDKLPVVKFTPFIKSWLARKVDNPEALSKLSYTKRQEEDYDYLIVAMKSLENSFDEFIEFNKRRCLKTKLVTIDEVISRMSGRDNAEKLKTFIKQEYDNYNITFVLLGGDEEYGNSNYIPHRGYSAEFMDYSVDYIADSDIAADMYYECLDGDELDDLEWEVYAARFAVDDDTELQNMIYKTIQYSEEPDKTAATKVVLAGEYLWANVTGGVVYGGDSMEQYVGTCTLHYTTTGFGDNWDITRFYEKDGDWSGSQLISQINNGLAWIDHLGHSNNFMIMKLNYSSSQNDMTKLTNTAYYIGYTEGCYCGSWDNRKVSFNGSINSGHHSQDCIAEGFTAATDNGSVAFISNTRFGLGDDGHSSADGTDGSSHRFHRYFHDAVFANDIHYLAMMIAYSKEENEEEILNTNMSSAPYWGQMSYCCFQVNALGDPALSVWTETPQDLEPEYELNGTTFTMQTEPHTWVALFDKDDNFLCNQLTGADGNCEITDDALTDYINNNPNEQITLRIKAHNYLPYEGIVGQTIISNSVNDKLLFSSSFNSLDKITRISYTLPVQGLVNISIFNSKGALIKTLVNENQSVGDHYLLFKSDNLSNGIYYCRLKSNNTQYIDKFFVTK